MEKLYQTSHYDLIDETQAFKAMSVTLKHAYNVCRESARLREEVSFECWKVVGPNFLSEHDWQLDNITTAESRRSVPENGELVEGGELIGRLYFGSFDPVKPSMFDWRRKYMQEGDCVVHSVSGFKLYSLNCEHAFCVRCWSKYFEKQIMDERNTRITCMQSRCDVLVDAHFIAEVMPDDEHKQLVCERLRRLILEDFIKKTDTLRFCPCTTECDQIVKLRQQTLRGSGHFALPIPIHCVCTGSYCFICAQPWHAPISCGLLQAWQGWSKQLLERKIDEESASEEWIYRNARLCPSCKIPIQKNEGCRHITCRQCNYHFCWFCLGPWAIDRCGSVDTFDINAHQQDYVRIKASMQLRLDSFKQHETEMHRLEQIIDGIKQIYAQTCANERDRRNALKRLSLGYSVLKHAQIFDFFIKKHQSVAENNPLTSLIDAFHEAVKREHKRVLESSGMRWTFFEQRLAIDALDAPFSALQEFCADTKWSTLANEGCTF